MRHSHGRAFAVALALLVAAVAGCAGTPGSAPPTGPSTGPRYALPAALCEVADLTALTELYPVEETGSALRVDDAKHCDSSLNGDGQRLVFTIDLLRIEDNLFASDPTLARQWFDGQRVRATGTPTDVDGVGSGAFWYASDEGEMRLETYDGNINLAIWVNSMLPPHELPADMPARLARVAAGTLAGLAG